MFDLAQLRCFVAVAEELNFSRAAERLNMTQPPLSRQIRLLEHQVGVQLLKRSTRNVSLTAVGRAFFHEAQALLERAELAALSARRFADGELGAIGLSFVPSAVFDFLPSVIADAQRERPGVRITLAEMNTFEQHEALRSRRVDLAIVRSPLNDPDITTECILREPFVLCLPIGHPRAASARIDLADLHEQAFITYSHSAYQPFSELLAGMFRSAGVRPRIVQSLGATLTILSLVNAGMGLALVPRSATSIPFTNVIARKIDLPDGVQSELFLAWRTDNDNPAFPAMLTAIRAASAAA